MLLLNLYIYIIYFPIGLRSVLNDDTLTALKEGTLIGAEGYSLHRNNVSNNETTTAAAGITNNNKNTTANAPTTSGNNEIRFGSFKAYDNITSSNDIHSNTNTNTNTITNINANDIPSKLRNQNSLREDIFSGTFHKSFLDFSLLRPIDYQLLYEYSNSIYDESDSTSRSRSKSSTSKSRNSISSISKNRINNKLIAVLCELQNILPQMRLLLNKQLKQDQKLRYQEMLINNEKNEKLQLLLQQQSFRTESKKRNKNSNKNKQNWVNNPDNIGIFWPETSKYDELIAQVYSNKNVDETSNEYSNNDDNNNNNVVEEETMYYGALSDQSKLHFEQLVEQFASTKNRNNIKNRFNSNDDDDDDDDEDGDDMNDINYSKNINSDERDVYKYLNSLQFDMSNLFQIGSNTNTNTNKITATISTSATTNNTSSNNSAKTTTATVYEEEEDQLIWTTWKVR